MAWTAAGRTFKTTTAEAAPPLGAGSVMRATRLVLIKTNTIAQGAGTKIEVKNGTVAYVDTFRDVLGTTGDRISVEWAEPADIYDLTVVVTGSPGTFEVQVDVA